MREADYSPPSPSDTAKMTLSVKGMLLHSWTYALGCLLSEDILAEVVGSNRGQRPWGWGYGKGGVGSRSGLGFREPTPELVSTWRRPDTGS